MGKEFLILTGPQHTNPDYSFSAKARAAYEYLEPLGAGILAAEIRRQGGTVRLMEMKPGRIGELERYIAESAGVLISARFYDRDSALQAIALANKHHKQNIVGGYGPTLVPESFQSATSIAIGEIEALLEKMVGDLMAGKLEPCYDTTGLPPYDIVHQYIWPDRTIYPAHPLARFSGHRHMNDEWARSCYNECEFCSAVVMQRGKIRARNPKDVIAQLEAQKMGEGDFLFLSDLNAMAIPREFLIEELNYIKHKGIRLAMEGTIGPLLKNLKQNPEQSLLKLMSPRFQGRGGCYAFLYGIDNVAEEKVSGSTDKYGAILKDAIKTFREFGIPLNLSVILGLDDHVFPDAFYQAAAILDELAAPTVFFHMATPYQGTEWGNKMYEERRVFETDSTKFNHRNSVFTPKNMTPDQLKQGYWWLHRHFYSDEAILRTAKRNFDAQIFRDNRLLATLLMGLPMGAINLAILTEVSARGLLDGKTQRQLDGGYMDWKKKSYHQF